MRKFDYATDLATAMADKEWLFALNTQMKPLPCVISSVHLYKDGPRFDIDFNVDPGGEVDETYHTRLRNIEARFLFPISNVHPVFEPILNSINPSI